MSRADSWCLVTPSTWLLPGEAGFRACFWGAGGGALDPPEGYGEELGGRLRLQLLVPLLQDAHVAQ